LKKESEHHGGEEHKKTFQIGKTQNIVMESEKKWGGADFTMGRDLN